MRVIKRHQVRSVMRIANLVLSALICSIAVVPVALSGQLYGPFTFTNAATSGTMRTPQTDDLWLVEPVEGSWPPEFIRIRSQSSGHYLHVEYDNLQASEIDPRWGSAMWVLENVGENVRMRNREKSGRYLYGVAYGALTMAAAGPRSPGDASALWLMADAPVSPGAPVTDAQAATASPSLDVESGMVLISVENYSAAAVDLYVDTSPNRPELVATLGPLELIQFDSFPGTVVRMAANNEWIGEYEASNEPEQQVQIGK